MAHMGLTVDRYDLKKQAGQRQGLHLSLSHTVTIIHVLQRCLSCCFIAANSASHLLTMQDLYDQPLDLQGGWQSKRPLTPSVQASRCSASLRVTCEACDLGHGLAVCSLRSLPSFKHELVALSRPITRDEWQLPCFPSREDSFLSHTQGGSTMIGLQPAMHRILQCHRTCIGKRLDIDF